MKRLLAMIMVIAMVLCLAACGGRMKGKYVLESMSADGVTVEGEMLEMVGVDGSYIEFDGKGGAEMRFEGETEDLKVDEKAKTLTDSTGEEVEFELDGDKLIIEVEGAEMVFVKE